MVITRRPALISNIEFARSAHHAAYRDVVERQFKIWDEAAQDQFFANDWASGEFEIVLWDGAACGYLSIAEYESHIHVCELVIAPEYQGRGIGSSLLRTTIEEARAKGIPVKLGALHENRALVLYRRLGYRETGRTETHTLMEWNA